MSIFVEVTSDRVEVVFGNLPRNRYSTNLATLICDAASEPYRRGESSRFFVSTHRLPLDELSGRPC